MDTTKWIMLALLVGMGGFLGYKLTQDAQSGVGGPTWWSPRSSDTNTKPYDPNNPTSGVDTRGY